MRKRIPYWKSLMNQIQNHDLAHKNMNDRTQQIETLIKLIELNNDDTWLDTFRSLRNGGYLPGGGAGSLNDWGPYYSGLIESVWYGKLYDILRYLFDNNLPTNKIVDFGPIKLRHLIQIIRCLKCDGKYQHPSSFENHVALDFYKRHLSDIIANKRLINILLPRKSFENEAAIEYRTWLENQYEENNIKIYDFVAAKYVCPHCRKNDFETAHDLYRISEDDGLKLVKQN